MKTRPKQKENMVKADLHVHSRFSNRPSEWFLQRIGAAESYTEPEQVYQLAKQRGMTFVTLTDHNRIEGALYLQEKYADEIITGTEFTAYFPEDGCKVHILVYGLSASDFENLQQIRRNIYDLRDYLKQARLAYSVAHATYSVNGRLTMQHLEKLILLFDVFESINGGRNRPNNLIWSGSLQRLTPAIIEDFYIRHRIEPISDDPWVKGFTGGSDDHAGVYIGQSFTVGQGQTVSEFLSNLRNKRTIGDGRSNHTLGLAFSIYKIAFEYLKQHSVLFSSTLFDQIGENIFGKPSSEWLNRLRISKIKYLGKKDERIHQQVAALFRILNQHRDLSPDVKFELVYEKLADLADESIINLIQRIKRDTKRGNPVKTVADITRFLPSLFLSIPFYSSLKYMYNTRPLLDELSVRFLKMPVKRRFLWFTDTVSDLNGVAITIRQVIRTATRLNYDLKVIAPRLSDESETELSETMIQLPSIVQFKLPYYEYLRVQIPSVLKALRIIEAYQPTEVIISTPGPIGLIGLIAAKLLNIRSVAIYHTDFSAQVKELAEDDSLARLVENAMHWFYSHVDEIRVPTREYLQILTSRGYPVERMTYLPRGIDFDLFRPNPADRTQVLQKYHLPDGLNLVFCGRISQDKNLDFLVQVYEKVKADFPEVNLILAGDGPYYDTLKARVKSIRNIYLIGRLRQEALPELYAAMDLFVFPSVTDTFGMAVIEAQACGLPAIVSDIGGPREIVRDQETGFVLPVTHPQSWVDCLRRLIPEIQQRSPRIQVMQTAAVNCMRENAGWVEMLADMLGPVPREDEHGPARPGHQPSPAMVISNPN